MTAYNPGLYAYINAVRQALDGVFYPESPHEYDGWTQISLPRGFGQGEKWVGIHFREDIKGGSSWRNPETGKYEDKPAERMAEDTTICISPCWKGFPSEAYQSGILSDAPTIKVKYIHGPEHAVKEIRRRLMGPHQEVYTRLIGYVDKVELERRERKARKEILHNLLPGCSDQTNLDHPSVYLAWPPRYWDKPGRKRWEIQVETSPYKDGSATIKIEGQFEVLKSLIPQIHAYLMEHKDDAANER